MSVFAKEVFHPEKIEIWRRALEKWIAKTAPEPMDAEELKEKVERILDVQTRQ